MTTYVRTEDHQNGEMTLWASCPPPTYLDGIMLQIERVAKPASNAGQEVQEGEGEVNQHPHHAAREDHSRAEESSETRGKFKVRGSHRQRHDQAQRPTEGRGERAKLTRSKENQVRDDDERGVYSENGNEHLTQEDK